MTSTPHTSCTHPATKAGRAACRKARAANEAREVEVTALRGAIVQSYYDNTAEAEEIISALRAIDPDLDYDLDIEEIVSRAIWSLTTGA
jgi:hypothetical protein